MEHFKRKKQSGSLFVLCVVAPVILYFAIFYYIPFFLNFVYAFCEYDYLQPPKWVGLKNVVRFLEDPNAWLAILNVFKIALVCVPLILAFSLLIAAILFQLKRGKTFFRSCIFATFLTPNVVAAIVFKSLFGEERGFINSFLMRLGLEKIPWFTTPGGAMATIMIVTVWNAIGYYMVILLAGLSGISPALYEAATIDGANSVQKFWRITIPQLKNSLIFCLIICTLGCLKAYSIVLVLTAGGPYGSTRTVLMEIFDQGINYWNVGYASVLAVFMAIIMMTISIVQLRVTKENEE